MLSPHSAGICLVLALLTLTVFIFIGGSNQECCRAVGNMTFEEIDWMIVPAKYVDCCNNTEVTLTVHNYSDKLSNFDVDGETITVDANSFTELKVVAVDNGSEYSAIPVMKLGQGEVRMRLWLKIEFR